MFIPIGFGGGQQQHFASDTNFAAAFGTPSNGSTNGNLINFYLIVLSVSSSARLVPN